LEIRAAVLDAQSCEISERLAQLERERQDLKESRSEVEQQRDELARERDDLRVSLEELQYQREAVQAEGDDLRGLYERLTEKFPEVATTLAADVAELGAATGQDRPATD
jgi:chromosome segregation ATPase